MDLDIRMFDEPDETRTFERGRLDLLTIGGRTLGRASYEPGWKWSEHVGPGLGTTSCDVEHLGFVVSGRAVAAMDDGTIVPLEAGGLFAIPVSYTHLTLPTKA